MDERWGHEGLTDPDLLRRSSSGDRGAATVLVHRYRRVTYSFALRLVRDRDRANRLVLDTFAHALAREPQFRRRRGAFLPRLLGITAELAAGDVRGPGPSP